MSLTTSNFIGPLTTVFTPPAVCLETVTYNPNGLWSPDVSKSGGLSPAVLLGATGQAPDLACYPPKFTVDRIYSPGVCPSGMFMFHTENASRANADAVRLQDGQALVSQRAPLETFS